MDNSKIGQLLMAQGSSDDALASYRDGLTVVKSLLSREPDSSDWQATRGMIDSNMGALLMSEGHRDEALRIYHDGLDSAKTLAAADPVNAEWQSSMVIAYYNLAEAGDDPGSNFASALSILKHLETSGVLPAEKKPLIGKIEGRLATLKHHTTTD